MNHLRYLDIPDEIHTCAHRINDYAKRQGWGGLMGGGMWAFNGLGNIDPYQQRIYELEGETKHIQMAWINSDRLRTEYQLQVEALHDAVDGLVKARGRHHTQLAFEALVALREQQRKANQP